MFLTSNVNVAGCIRWNEVVFYANRNYSLGVFPVFRLNIYFILLWARTPNSYTHTHACNVNNLNTKITKLTQKMKIHWVAIISKRNEIAPSSSDPDMCVTCTNDDMKRLYWIWGGKERKTRADRKMFCRFTLPCNW